MPSRLSKARRCAYQHPDAGTAIHGAGNLNLRERCFLIGADPGGKLWSKRDWCLVPVYQHDFGSSHALIGGGPAFKKAGPPPVGESVIFRKPSRAWCLISDDRSM